MNFEERKQQRQTAFMQHFKANKKFAELMKKASAKEPITLNDEVKDLIDDAHVKVFGYRIDRSCPNCFLDALHVLTCIFEAVVKIKEVVSEAVEVGEKIVNAIKGKGKKKNK